MKIFSGEMPMETNRSRYRSLCTQRRSKWEKSLRVKKRNFLNLWQERSETFPLTSWIWAPFSLAILSKWYQKSLSQRMSYRGLDLVDDAAHDVQEKSKGRKK